MTRADATSPLKSPQGYADRVSEGAVIKIEIFRQEMSSPGRDGAVFCQTSGHGETNVGVTSFRTTVILAQVVETLQTGGAGSTANVDLDPNPVTGLEASYTRTYGLNFAAPFVPRDVRIGNSGEGAVEDLEIRGADRR